jgi:hypothetical protein
VRQLAGRTIEIYGPVKGYDGRAQIVLDKRDNSRGMPPKFLHCPRSYAVEKKGHSSAGSIRRTKTRTTDKKKVPADLPIGPDDPSE